MKKVTKKYDLSDLVKLSPFRAAQQKKVDNTGINIKD